MERTIKSKMKRFASLLLAVATLVSVVPAALANPADNFSDFPTGWSKPAMEAAVYNGLLVGIGGDKIGPQKNLTRAEMAAVMVRAFGATTKADVSAFTDLDVNSWYYDSVASAVKMGALAGISNTEMAPEDNITREQVFSVLARILALSGDDTAVLSKFKDRGNISDWAISTVIPMVERGYVNGDDLGNINPKAYITREEFAQVMYTAIKKYITESGTYEEDLDGIVVLRTGDITLDGVTVTGDLVVGDGAAKDSIILQDVTVDGRLLTRGGTITLKKTTVDDGVVVLNPNGITKFNNYRSEDVFHGILEHTDATFLTHSGGISSPTGDYITVNYYRGFTEDKLLDSDSVKLENGVAKVSSLPDISAYYWDADWDGKPFKKSDYMPSGYPIKNDTYQVKPSFWYKDGEEYKPFDETVELTKSTSVHLMYNTFTLTALDAPIFVRYSKDTRLMDSAKLFAHQVYNALDKAKKGGNPLYESLYKSLDTNVKEVFNGTNLVFEDGEKQYLKPFIFPLALSNALKESDVKGKVVSLRIGNLKKDIADPGNVAKLLKWPGVKKYLEDEGVSIGTDADVIAYVTGLTDINGICNAIYATNEYKDVIAAINMGDDGKFIVTPTNIELLRGILEELEIITFDTVMEKGSGSAITGMVSILGKDTCKDIFDGGREVYCDELADLIADVENGTSASEDIPSAFTLIFDLIEDVLRPLYDRAEKKIVNKFSASVRYSENPYLQYLVEDHDVISEMFGYDGPVPAGQEEKRTGYYIKDLTEYAKYMVKLLIAIDDAFSVYGDNGELGLSDAEFKDLYDAVFADIYDVHDEIDKLLKDFHNHGKLPAVLEKALTSVKQLNDIFVQIEPTLNNIIGAYFDTVIYDDLSNHRPGSNSMNIAEILTGREDVTFTIDSFYEAIGNNEATIQKMLKSFSDSGSITGVADLLKDKFGVRADMVDGIVDVITNIKDNGFSHYRESNPAGATTIDVYSIPFGGSYITLKRSLEM